MKYQIIYILTFCTLFLGVNAQETIVLDGMRIKKEKLNHFRGFSLDEPDTLRSMPEKSMKQNDFKRRNVYSSKRQESYALTSIFGKDGGDIEIYEKSVVKFFAKQGHLKWEKEFKEKNIQMCYPSEDGKYLSIYSNPIEELPGGLFNKISIYDENGILAFPELENVIFLIPGTNDLVLYAYNKDITKNTDDNKKIFVIDLKNKKEWNHNFEFELQGYFISSNGDFISCLSNDIYYIFDRNGNIILKQQRNSIGEFMRAISNDGKYFLSKPNPIDGKSSFFIYSTKPIRITEIPYKVVADEKLHLYGGGCFVNNSKNLVALTSIIAPWKAALMFFDFDGNFLGHYVYSDIKTSFYKPDVTLNPDGSFEVYADTYYYGTLTLPNVNTLKYLKK